MLTYLDVLTQNCGKSLNEVVHRHRHFGVFLVPIKVDQCPHSLCNYLLSLWSITTRTVKTAANFTTASSVQFTQNSAKMFLIQIELHVFQPTTTACSPRRLGTQILLCTCAVHGFCTKIRHQSE